MLFWNKARKLKIVKLCPYLDLAGPCKDYDPRCPSLVLAGWCDYPTSFNEEINFRDYCMASCGFCNKLVEPFSLQIFPFLIMVLRDVIAYIFKLNAGHQIEWSGC